MTYFKRCLVPCCSNSSKTTPDKIFLTIPRGETGEAWIRAAGLTPNPIGRYRFCCEDHFILSEDCVNWMEYKLVGTRLRVKKNVVPHQYMEKPPKIPLKSQVTESERKRADRTVGFKRKILSTPSSSKLKLKLPGEIPFFAKQLNAKRQRKRLRPLAPKIEIILTSDSNNSSSFQTSVKKENKKA